MLRVSRSFLVAAVVSMLTVLSETSAARDFVDGWEGGYWAGTTVSDSIPSMDTWRTYYTTHARVRSGPEKQLANGVRWRLATDQRTGIAMPRIISMPDNKNREVANSLLETVHGGAILFAKTERASLRAHAKEYAENGPGWPVSNEDYKLRLKVLQNMMKERLVEQTDVALTYASTGFASLIDLGFINKIEGTYLPRIIRSVTLDLERRQVFTMEACPEGSFKRPGAIYNPLFRFADLLDICDQASLEQFEALVASADDRMRAAMANSKDPSFEDCRWASIKCEQTFVVYLTVDGLAVHLTVFSPNAASRSCPLTLSRRNPLIVPYSELQPLMKAGALREELLKTK